MRNIEMRSMKNLTPKILLPAVVILITSALCQAQELSAHAKANKFAQQSNNNSANVTFSSGRDLIDEAQWAKAEQKFSQYITNYPNEKNLDAAFYWMAYSQYKLSRYGDSQVSIARLLNRFPNTNWKEDANLLLAQLPQDP